MLGGTKATSSGRAQMHNKKFNKRKSPYQQYSDAKYNFGVYFNPVMNGL